MKSTFLKIHPKDNVLVALQDLPEGTVIAFEGDSFALTTKIAAKHKFSLLALEPGDDIRMYGVLVGKAIVPIAKGGPVSTQTIKHASNTFELGKRKLEWHHPDTRRFKNKTFMGYHRADGSVGTANYWVVVPLVFAKTGTLTF